MRTTFSFAVAGEPVAEGRLRHVFVDAGTTEKKPIPDDVRAALDPYVTA
jgi:acyl-CoA thioesterase FadM